MTKQEEIREWIKDRLSGYGCPDSFLSSEADTILSYLDSKGVVLKANIKGKSLDDMDFSAIEPLIEVTSATE